MLEFSIIIPALNEESTIVSCLRSIFFNEYPRENYEVIVVDNGSADQTVLLAERAGARVVEVPGVNISALRNHGAYLARGRILAFMDADCTVADDWLQQASRYLQRTDVAMFGSPPGIPEKSTWVQRTWLLVRAEQGSGKREVAWLESMNMFVPRSYFFAVGGFNEDLVTCEDVDLSYRLSGKGRIISDPAIKAIHHGEARTVKEFFRKECWRGRSNYAGLMAHGLSLSELPSLLLPIYFLAMPFGAVLAWIVTGSWKYFFAGCLLWQLPICFLVVLKLRGRILNLITVGRLWILYNIYYCARAVAVVV